MIREWIKSIFLEAFDESLYERSHIISSRPPCEKDSMSLGSYWEHGNDTYIASSIKWTKIESEGKEMRLPKAVIRL